MPSKPVSTLNSQAFAWNDRPFVRAEVPAGDNRGKIFTVAQPLAERYEIVNFFASGGMGLLLEGLDLRTQCRVRMILCTTPTRNSKGHTQPRTRRNGPTPTLKCSPRSRTW